MIKDSWKGGRGIFAVPGVGAGGATAGLAGEFLGDVSISGTLSMGTQGVGMSTARRLAERIAMVANTCFT